VVKDNGLQEEPQCPGERYSITWAVCRARRARLYPKCRGCKFNTDELEVQAKAEALARGKDFDVIFKAYDIRGVVDEQLDEEVAWKVGHATSQYLLSGLTGPQRGQPSGQTVVLGYDMRTSSERLSKACLEGILATGARCVLIGEVETPAVYFAVATLEACGGIMITASHNAAAYNGFKIAGPAAAPVGMGSGLEKIKQIAETIKSTDSSLHGSMLQEDISSRYVLHVKSFAGDIKPMKLVLDASNGMASKWTPSLLRQFNLDVEPLNYERSGRFSHDPNPLVEENLVDLRQRVLATLAGFGVCFDGDGVRVVFVDEKAEPVRPDFITALLAAEFLKDERGASIVYDLRSTWAVREEIEKRGGVPRRERVGHTFVKQAMRKYNAPFGGEVSGHYYYRDNFFCDSGIITLLKVLTLLSGTRRKFSTLLKPFKKYHSTGEVNFEVEDADDVIHNLAKAHADGKIDFLDGTTVEYGDWWFNVRKSNTEPLVRLNIEAKTEKLKDEKFAELKSIIGTPKE